MTDNRTIELTDHELRAYQDFQEALSDGSGIGDAVRSVKAVYRRSCRAIFYRWLLSGRVK